MAMTPLEKAIRAAQTKFFKTDAGKDLMAQQVAAALSPEQIAADIKKQLTGPTDVQAVLSQSVQDTNKEITEALKTSDAPVYVPGGTVQAATAPNYALYAIIAVGLGLLLFRKKGKLL
jgi:hypothetical protein